jgi:hypothetical protein
MAHRKKGEVSKPASKSVAKPVSQPELPAEEPIEEQPVQARVIKRPDGYYWESKGKEARGPFATRAEAEADLLAGGAAAGEFEAEETLQEAESELGISEWIDPDTGGPAEDNVPRIEDH